jgi:hypothetical protein
MSEQFRTRPAQRRGIALFVALAVFLAFAGALLAAQAIIDTNDNTLAEWTSQSIPLFQTDPAGDTPITSDDLVNVSVASADIKQASGNVPGLTFRAQTSFPPSLSQPGRAVAAMLDCDRNGLDNERQDRWVVYNTTGPRTDEVTLYTGDQYFGLIPTAVLPKLLGQRVQNQLEWAIPISELPIRGDEPPELGKVVDCRHQVDIRIATMQFVTPTGFIVLDTLTPPLGWDISTGEPLSATLTISKAPELPADVRLDWNATAQSAEYIVRRSMTSPYDGFAEWARVAEVTYLDPGAATDLEPQYYYQVQGASGDARVDPSNTVGVVKFSLAAGDAPPE